jgi:hypothetical protein
MRLAERKRQYYGGQAEGSPGAPAGGGAELRTPGGRSKNSDVSDTGTMHTDMLPLCICSVLFQVQDEERNGD